MVFKTAVCLLVIFCVSFVSTQQVLQGECKHRDQTYGVGYTWQVSGKCLTYSCKPGGLTIAVGCSPVMVPENSSCHLEEGNSKKLYPYCCPQVVCPQDTESALVTVTVPEPDVEFSTEPLNELTTESNTEPLTEDHNEFSTESHNEPQNELSTESSTTSHTEHHIESITETNDAS